MTEKHVFGTVDLKSWQKAEVIEDTQPVPKMNKETAMAIAVTVLKYQIYAMELERKDNTTAYRATKEKYDAMLLEYQQALEFIENMDV
jgi:hypothetical protein